MIEEYAIQQAQMDLLLGCNVLCVWMGTEEQATGEWVVSSGWFETDWGGGQPSMDWIPAECNDNPVFLLHTEGHVALINRYAGDQPCQPPLLLISRVHEEDCMVELENTRLQQSNMRPPGACD